MKKLIPAVHENLPDSHRPFTDKYFLSNSAVLKGMSVNPYVGFQTFIRKGPGQVAGIDKAISAVMKYSPRLANSGKIYALPEGSDYSSTETLMVIEGPVQDIFELETMYLSILSGETSKANGAREPDLEWVTNTVKETVDILEKSKFGPRPISYFGARHFGYEWDARMAKAAHDGGASSTSTDNGAATFGQTGVGTTPHAFLLSVAADLAEKHDMEYALKNYAVEAMTAFDNHTPKDVPRIFLADTFNREITDTLKVARALGDSFGGPRFDTNGAVVAEGTIRFREKQYWSGKGVVVDGVVAARSAYIGAGFPELMPKITSGFSNPEKVAAFVEAEEKYDMQLFDFLGAGYADGQITATSDMFGYKDAAGAWHDIHKVGRPPKPNSRLQEVDLSVF